MESLNNQSDANETEEEIMDQILVVEGDNLLVDANERVVAPDQNANVIERPRTPRFDYQQFKARLSLLSKKSFAR